MGISEGLDGGIGVDCSVGTIVWVRRRNGSWWPGRILGPEELSASHLMSPRSGTPVKLLGREDASVDWYNLEKSKRVKAFRCGEFDACIERAEASQGVPIKKREKYARREDAILHALELEKQQHDMKQKRPGTISNGISNKTSGAHRRELNSFSPDIFIRDDEPGVHSKFAGHRSQMLSRKAALAHEEENMGNSLYVHKGKSSKQYGWEEDNPEALPRMRGLQDFGLRIAPPKKKLSQSVTWETSRRSVENHVDVHSNAGYILGGGNHTSGSKNSPAIKRKRSQGGPSEDSLVKKRDRRRPLVQVLQSSVKLPASHSFQSDYDSGIISMQGERDPMGGICRAKRSRSVCLPVDSDETLDNGGCPDEQMPVTATHFGMSDCIDHPGSLAEEYTSSGLAEATESDSSECDYLEPDMDENGNFLKDDTKILVPETKDCDPPAVQVSENVGSLNNDEMPLPGYMPQFHPEDQTMDASPDVGVSKWHMKGKRNIRNLTKRPMDLMDGKISGSADKCNGSFKGTPYDNTGSSLKMRRIESSSQRTVGRGFYHKKEASHYALDGDDQMEKDLSHSQPMGYGNRRNPFALQAPKDRGRSHSSFNDSDNDSYLLSPRGWDADGPSPCVGRRAYWEESDECFDSVYAGHLGDEMEPMLIDVDLKVQAASYQGEHVPLVSLMSRLNGKAIIGHPVQIEILEDGSLSHLVPKYNADLDEGTAPAPVWRTARRTAMHRVPRSNSASSALDGEDVNLQYSDPESKPPPRKAYSGYFNHHARLAKRSISHARRPSASGKSQKKLLKRVSLSSQKTRTLSSLATEQRLGGENVGVKLSRGNDILDTLIKPEGSIPLVTCVPVKVVFSRILEAVGRPSASAHRVRMASPAVRGGPS